MHLPKGQEVIMQAQPIDMKRFFSFQIALDRLFSYFCVLYMNTVIKLLIKMFSDGIL